MNIGIDTITASAVNTYNPVNTKESANKKTADPVKTDAKKDVNDKSAEGAVFEKSSEQPVTKATYSINKKSPEERAAIVQQMKQAQEDQQQALVRMVEKMLSGQAGKYKQANSGISMISGTVTEEARRKAAEDISEDGYWGVKQTSQRLFDFASALAGDDVEKMKKMQAAMNKGIGQAANKLGGLPSLCQQTQDAANKLFEDYYESKNIKADE